MVHASASRLHPALQLHAARGLGSWVAYVSALLSDHTAPLRPFGPPLFGPFQSDRLPSRLYRMEPWLTGWPPTAGPQTAQIAVVRTTACPVDVSGCASFRGGRRSAHGDPTPRSIDLSHSWDRPRPGPHLERTLELWGLSLRVRTLGACAGMLSRCHDSVWQTDERSASAPTGRSLTLHGSSASAT